MHMEKKAKASKRLLVLGATGGTGRALVEQAVERGHQVTALVRSPEKLGPARPGVTVRKGDITNVRELEATLPGHDAVLSALGHAAQSPPTILGDGARSLVTAMQATEVRRLLVVSAAMLFEDGGWLAWLLRTVFLSAVANDSREMERVVMESKLEWTIARPPRLTRGPCTGSYAVEDDRLPAGGGAVSRADVAHFLLEELETPKHLRRIAGMASR
jgi:putative NADH-flavin reductase